MELELNTTMQYWWEALSISLSIPSQQQTQGTLFVKAQFNLNKMSFGNKLIFSKILMMKKVTLCDVPLIDVET